MQLFSRCTCSWQAAWVFIYKFLFFPVCLYAKQLVSTSIITVYIDQIVWRERTTQRHRNKEILSSSVSPSFITGRSCYIRDSFLSAEEPRSWEGPLSPLLLLMRCGCCNSCHSDIHTITQCKVDEPACRFTIIVHCTLCRDISRRMWGRGRERMITRSGDSREKRRGGDAKKSHDERQLTLRWWLSVRITMPDSRVSVAAAESC